MTKIYIERQIKQNKEFQKERNDTGGFKLLYFKMYNKGTVMKTMWNWQKQSHTDHWNQTESRDRPTH